MYIVVYIQQMLKGYLKFDKQITIAAPQLAAHRCEVRARLGQALQNKRKYVGDLKLGKRKKKSR